MIKLFEDFINENILKIDIQKNPEKAKVFGKQYGQDVEPHGNYVTHLKGAKLAPHYLTGFVQLQKPLFIEVNDDNLIEWKYELSTKYKAKGKKLTDKLMNLNYDGIVTRFEDGEYGEIILFPNANYLLN